MIQHRIASSAVPPTAWAVVGPVHPSRPVVRPDSSSILLWSYAAKHNAIAGMPAAQLALRGFHRRLPPQLSSFGSATGRMEQLVDGPGSNQRQADCKTTRPSVDAGVRCTGLGATCGSRTVRCTGRVSIIRQPGARCNCELMLSVTVSKRTDAAISLLFL